MVPGYEKHKLEFLQLNLEPFKEPFVNRPANVPKQSEIFRSDWDIVIIEFLTWRGGLSLDLEVEIAQDLNLHGTAGVRPKFSQGSSEAQGFEETIIFFRLVELLAPGAAVGAVVFKIARLWEALSLSSFVTTTKILYCFARAPA